MFAKWGTKHVHGGGGLVSYLVGV